MGIQTGARDGSKSINCPRVLESHLSHNSCKFSSVVRVSRIVSWRLGVVSWNFEQPSGRFFVRDQSLERYSSSPGDGSKFIGSFDHCLGAFRTCVALTWKFSGRYVGLS